MARVHLATAILALICLCLPSARAADVDQKLRDMLPESIRSSNQIRVGSDPQQPPYVFYAEDNTTMIGLERDLMAEMAARLGITFETSPAQFASIIPAIRAGRFDLGISAFGDFVEREKVIDIIDYTLEGTGIIVPQGNPNKIAKISDACGLRAGGVQGSIPLQLLDKQKELCPSDKPLNVMQFPSNDQVKVAMRSGRLDLSMDTVGVAGYSLEHQPTTGMQLELVESAKYAVGYQGILVDKKNPELRDTIKATLQAMIDDGSYKTIFEKWKLSQNMVEKITVNDAARWADYMKLD